MDLDMPVKDGFQAGKEIYDFYRKNKIKDFKIAAHSACWDEQAKKKA